MSLHSFAWEQLPAQFLGVLADSLEVEVSTVPDDLAKRYGPVPNAEFVRENWLVLRDEWLPSKDADETRSALVADLWELGVGYADDRPAGAKAEITFLRTCNNARGLREAVAAELAQVAESSGDGKHPAWSPGEGQGGREKDHSNLPHASGPKLEDEAIDAVRHRGSHLQIIASAGSGKTEVVAQRAADLMADGVDPSAIIAFTFTERAADELKARICARVEELGPGSGQRQSQVIMS